MVPNSLIALHFGKIENGTLKKNWYTFGFLGGSMVENDLCTLTAYMLRMNYYMQSGCQFLQEPQILSRYFGLQLSRFRPVLIYDMHGRKFHRPCYGLGVLKDPKNAFVRVFWSVPIKVKHKHYSFTIIICYLKFVFILVIFHICPWKNPKSYH